MTKRGEEELGTVRRQDPVYWAYAEQLAMLSILRPSPLLFCQSPAHDYGHLSPSQVSISRGDTGRHGARGRSQPGWEPDVVDNRERLILVLAD
jgi:hypothetical protein